MGLASLSGLGRFSVYSGFGLDRLQCILLIDIKFVRSISYGFLSLE